MNPQELRKKVGEHTHTKARRSFTHTREKRVEKKKLPSLINEKRA